MDSNQIVEKINQLINEKYGKGLTQLEKDVIYMSLENKTYTDMQRELRKDDDRPYSLDYIKQSLAPELWKRLSEVLGKKITKTNAQFFLPQLLDFHNEESLSPQSDAQKSQSETVKQPFYVKRPPIEKNCYKEIERDGALIRIRAAKKMGKTWLMENILNHASNQLNYQIVRLNLLLPDEKTINNLDKFLQWFCASITRKLPLENKIEEYWEENFGSNDNCTAYFDSYILAKINTPLVLGLDNVDRIFPSTVAPDFFRLLRSWYEDAKAIKKWTKLRLVMAYSTEVYIPLEINNSPFNVGLAIELPEFNLKQLKELSELHKLDWDEHQIKQLMEMVGGHPYLNYQAIQFQKTHPKQTLEDFLQTATTDEGIYRNHLQEILLEFKSRFKKDSTLKDAVKTLVKQEKPVKLNFEQSLDLYRMGIVHWHKNEVEISCKLYRSYFKDHLEMLS